MAVTTIGWTGTALREALKVARDIKVDGDVFLAAGEHAAGTVVSGFTFNPWIGCEKISRACKKCYAQALVEGRMGYGNPNSPDPRKRLKVWGPAATTGRPRTAPDNWKRPRRWNELAASLGVRLKVFCGSLMDVGEDHADARAARPDLFALIDATPHLDWLLLTKRPEVLASEWPAQWKQSAASNVWAMATVENQDAARERIPHLLSIPAVVRGLSCEPLCGQIDLDPPLCQYEPVFHEVVEGDPPWCVTCDSEAVFGHWLDPLADEDQAGINWVVAGGESGSGHETMDLAWLQRLRDDCAQRGVALFVKQDSGALPGRQGRIPDDLWAVKRWPELRERV
jgi:protein gp37